MTKDQERFRFWLRIYDCLTIPKTSLCRIKTLLNKTSCCHFLYFPAGIRELLAACKRNILHKMFLDGGWPIRKPVKCQNLCSFLFDVSVQKAPTFPSLTYADSVLIVQCQQCRNFFNIVQLNGENRGTLHFNRAPSDIGCHTSNHYDEYS